MSRKGKVKDKQKSLPSRREFIKSTGKVIAFAAAIGTGLGWLGKSQASAPALNAIGQSSSLAGVAEIRGERDVLIRMQQELNLALTKPLEERHWHMVIDLRKCVGCSACTIACVSENKLPPGVVYRPVLDEEIGTYPNVTRRFTPRPCMHCDITPCTGVCPVGATWKQPDGIVVVDYKKCIGCRYCLTACPYSARTSDFGGTYNKGTAISEGIIVGQTSADDYERLPNFEYGKKWDRPDDEGSPIGNARKCHFCSHRLANGMLPACVTTCIGRATYFGDANNPESLVSRLVASPNVIRLKEELGTEPSTYYLI